MVLDLLRDLVRGVARKLRACKCKLMPQEPRCLKGICLQVRACVSNNPLPQHTICLISSSILVSNTFVALLADAEVGFGT